MAPRPHNSGHWSLDAAITSQFEQQARVLAGLPLGATRQHSPALMLNLLGDLWFHDDRAQEPDWAGVLNVPQAKLHLYGKAQARPGRKMGHVTLVGETAEACCAAAAEVRRVLRIAG
jgi:5-(carboxyamino)imidazole ribonucleotide synthase